MALLLRESALEIGLLNGDFKTIVDFMGRNIMESGFSFLSGLNPEELDMAIQIVDSGYKARERQGPFMIDPNSKLKLMVNGLRTAKKADQVSRLSAEIRPLVPPSMAGDATAIKQFTDSVIEAEPLFGASRFLVADLANDALIKLYPGHHPGLGLNAEERGAVENYWSLGIYMGFVALERAQVEELAL